MVESSGGSCRCACQDEFQDSQDQSSGCCSPHVFTSILLGILSCVLMTGGVFLAFHRWDPMWLMVSGVGVVLILIGTILHCCNNMSQRPKRHSSAGKGCCPRPVPPDHNGHMIANSGSLTEQLLPLSNARSVSQLSLNMLPGYFPPVVTAYGIEQHSAVVQNINRLVQQQQQQQQQQPQSPGSISPSAVGSAAGKSFIVLSLPGDASAANIQNLVATVYQLDGNSTETTANESIPNITAPIVSIKPNSPVPLILKNAEVQTCNMWPVAPATAVAASTSGENSAASRNSSTDEGCGQQQPISRPTVPSASCGSTQTDDVPVSENINLMDCSTDVSPICDNLTNACDNNQLPDSNSALVNIPESSSSSSADLLNAPLTTSTASAAECTSSVLVDIPEPPAENALASSSSTPAVNLVNVLVDSPSNHPSGHPPEVLVDISEDSTRDINSNSTGPLLEGLVVNNNNNNFQQAETLSEATTYAAVASTSGTVIEMPQNLRGESTNSDLQSLNPELLLSADNLSTVDTEIDDEELMERSSPPPTYEDVTLEGESVGAFGLAYGTI